MDKLDLLEILDHVDPALCTYQEWCNVGMALKFEGYTASAWDLWSRRDSKRYHPGECFQKWNGFNGASNPVTGGTIFALAKAQGWQPENTSKGSYELDWDSTIGKDDLAIVDPNWVEGQELHEPKRWSPAKQLITYLELLFDSSENVGYVTKTWEKDGKFLPSSGSYDRTAGQLIEELNKCGNDIGAVLGDYNEEAGAWIRFNPLDGKGVKNDNVTEFRYALVESDTMEIEKQYALMKELELPIAVLVHSGKKSLHAIVRIEAANYDEYRKRVDYLYNVCQKNGLKIDSQNRNPSRLSRMPGVIRNGAKQYIVDQNIGKGSWNEWKEWIESVNDDLPEPESMADAWDNLPDLAPALIEGVLRQGHKMLLAGPSKAGKSYALIELCIAIAEKKKWLGFQCAQGKILYVNLELDRASCLHRFRDVYEVLGIAPQNLANIDIWNLRGKSIPMDKLAPKLIRRAAKKNYIGIIIDPIYKVITGDENSADQMAAFCNQFDKVCTELGCAVIYCHHHSKGSQGNKRSMDRASGSGVFARDPDALLDLIELQPEESVLKQVIQNDKCDIVREYLNQYGPENWEDSFSQDDFCSAFQLTKKAKDLLPGQPYRQLCEALTVSERRLLKRTAWRIEGTLREFEKFPPVNMWFDYPVHVPDTDDLLKLSEASGEGPAWKQNFDKKKTKEERRQDRKQSLETAFEMCKEEVTTNGKVSQQATVEDLSDYLGITEKTLRNRVKEHSGFWMSEGKIGRK